MAPRGLIQTAKTSTGATGAKSTGGASSPVVKPVPIPGPGNLSYTQQPDGSIKLSDGRTINWNTGTSAAPIPASQIPAGAQVREVPVVSSGGQTAVPMYQIVGGTGYQTTTQTMAPPTVDATGTGGMDAWTKFLDDQRKKNEAFQLQLTNAQNAPSAADRLNQAQFNYAKTQDLLAQQRAGRGALQQGQNKR